MVLVVVEEAAALAAADRVVIVGFTGSRLGERVLVSLRVVGPSRWVALSLPAVGWRIERVRLKPVVDDMVRSLRSLMFRFVCLLSIGSGIFRC